MSSSSWIVISMRSEKTRRQRLKIKILNKYELIKFALVQKCKHADYKHRWCNFNTTTITMTATITTTIIIYTHWTHRNIWPVSWWKTIIDDDEWLLSAREGGRRNWSLLTSASPAGGRGLRIHYIYMKPQTDSASLTSGLEVLQKISQRLEGFNLDAGEEIFVRSFRRSFRAAIEFHVHCILQVLFWCWLLFDVPLQRCFSLSFSLWVSAWCPVTPSHQVRRIALRRGRVSQKSCLNLYESELGLGIIVSQMTGQFDKCVCLICRSESGLSFPPKLFRRSKENCGWRIQVLQRRVSSSYDLYSNLFNDSA